MMFRPPPVAMLVVFFMVVGLGGCQASSAWSGAFVPERALGGALAPAPLVTGPKGDPVQIRSITWERMEAAMRDWEHEATTSDVHPEDWDASKKQDVRAKLLRGLQYSGDPGAAVVVGRAAFKTTDIIRPESPEDREVLREFARRSGSNYVIWASRYVGKADAVVQESVTSYRSGTEWRRETDGTRRSNPYNDSTTTWVPIRIQKDETAYIAVFLRI